LPANTSNKAAGIKYYFWLIENFFMVTAVFKKLRIKENDILLTKNAPANFKKSLQDLPAGVKIVSSGNNYQQVHWFVLNQAEMEKDKDNILKLLKDDTILWIYYPKGSSKLQTDLTRDKGWDALLKHDDTLTWLSLISFDDTWSTFGCRLKTDADKRKEQKPKERPIFDYVDPKTKSVRIPGDLENAFKKNKQEAAFFNSLSFTNKKEYIEWIVTAKQEATRLNSISGTLEKLKNGLKNPSAR
jgi:hypothetical protein